MAVLAVGMTMMCVTMTSCSKNDNPVNDEPEFNEETLRYVEGIPQTAIDELLLFQNHIVEIDSLGNFVRSVNGIALDPSDFSILSIGVKDLAEARSIFESWLPDDPLVTEITPNVLTFYPKDEEGNPQGDIYFTPSDADDLIAQVTFSEETNLLHFTAIRFIPNALWPDIPGDSDSPYKLWDYYFVLGTVPGILDNVINSQFQCVRERGNGKSGLLAAVPNTIWNPVERYDDMILDKNYYWGPNESLAKEVANALKGNWDEWGFKNDEEIVWINKKKFALFTAGSYTINLKTGKTTYWDAVWTTGFYKIHTDTNCYPQLNVIEF